jgi:hypothetical protein
MEKIVNLKYQFEKVNEKTFKYFIGLGRDDFKESLILLLKLYREKKLTKLKNFILFQPFINKPEKKSLILMDLTELPIKFRFKDLNNRAATEFEKKTLADFLLDHCTSLERNGPNFWDWFYRGGVEAAVERASSTINTFAAPLPGRPLPTALEELNSEQAPCTDALISAELHTKNWYKMGVFGDLTHSANINEVSEKKKTPGNNHS